MILKEELSRAIEDRDLAETDVEIVGERLRQMEHLGVDEEDSEYIAEESEYNDLQNKIMYLGSVIADLEQQIYA